MNGAELAGRQIKVGRAASSNAPLSGNAFQSHSNPLQSNALNIASQITNSLAQRRTEDSLTSEENMTISSKQRYMIMQKLQRDDPKVYFYGYRYRYRNWLLLYELSIVLSVRFNSIISLLLSFHSDSIFSSLLLFSSLSLIELSLRCTS